MERQAESIGDTVRQVATLQKVASWSAAHGSDEDVFIAAASLCRLTGSLADQMMSHGISVAETSGHRVALIPSFRADRIPNVLVTELHRERRPAPVAVPVSDSGEGRGHHRLCPLGGGETRWYICAVHEPSTIFQAGAGYLDAIANSCPRCARLSRNYIGCACEQAERPVDREKRKGRKAPPPLPMPDLSDDEDEEEDE